jgi:serine/threonine protein kinase
MHVGGEACASGSGGKFSSIGRCDPTGAGSGRRPRLRQRGIIHRDIKPENILLARGTRGWPISAWRAGGGRCRPARRTGLAVGTPTYMSPGKGAAGRSTPLRPPPLGCVLYEMLAGAAAHGPDGAGDRAKREEPAPLVRRARPR